MCGIVGYVGSEQAVSVLLNGLEKLEYRGYDSAGIAVYSENEFIVKKSKGRLKVLKDYLNSIDEIKSTIGIGHTRWATHGEPSDVNSHPHVSLTGKFVVVHNGIFENYLSVKNKLIQKGYTFTSETDTEVIAHLLDYYYNGDILDTVIRLQNKMEGTYALGILCLDNPNEIIAMRKDSPLVIGACSHGNMMASDIPAILNYTRDFYQLEEKEIVVLSPDSIKFYDINKDEIAKETFHVDWDIDSAEKGGYEHFMLKEIMEQPKALADTILPHINEGEVLFDTLPLTRDELEGFERFFIVACGSAYHAGIIGKYVIQQLTGKPVEVELGSEFRYSNPLVGSRTLVIIISQSGETLDSLTSLKYAKEKGAKTLAIVNVIGSSIAKEAEFVVYTNAGPEIAVATTKAYSCQLAVLYLLAIHFAKKLNTAEAMYLKDLVSQLELLPDKVSDILADHEKVQYLASRYYGSKDVFFIGRNLDYAAGLEGSLKLKEISYIHSEAYAAGELKHGTIALIEEGTLVIAIAVCEKMFDKLMSNVREVKARGANVLGLTWNEKKEIEAFCDYSFYIPSTADIFTPSLTIIPLQLFSYYVASMRGLDIDKPRNLAKSVTVE